MDDEERTPSPEEVQAIIAAQQMQVRDTFHTDDRLLYGAWGLAWGIGYLAMFLSSDAEGMPGAPGGFIFMGLLCGAAVMTIVHAERRARGLGGHGAMMHARLGATWPVAFVAMFFVFGGAFRLGISGPGVAVFTNSLPCLVVACIFMASGAVWHDKIQFRLGVWIAIVTAVVAIIGPPYLYVGMSVLGGGGFLVAAVLAHSERRRLNG